MDGGTGSGECQDRPARPDVVEYLGRQLQAGVFVVDHVQQDQVIGIQDFSLGLGLGRHPVVDMDAAGGLQLRQRDGRTLEQIVLDRADQPQLEIGGSQTASLLQATERADQRTRAAAAIDRATCTRRRAARLLGGCGSNVSSRSKPFQIRWILPANCGWRCRHMSRTPAVLAITASARRKIRRSVKLSISLARQPLRMAFAAQRVAKIRDPFDTKTTFQQQSDEMGGDRRVGGEDNLVWIVGQQPGGGAISVGDPWQTIIVG